MITFTRSLPLNPGHSHSSTRLNTPRLAHLGCSGKKSGRDRRLAACETVEPYPIVLLAPRNLSTFSRCARTPAARSRLKTP